LRPPTDWHAKCSCAGLCHRCTGEVNNKRSEGLNRIPQLDPERATGKTKRLFDDAGAKLGAVPNLFRVLGNAPVALEGYLNFSATLAGGNLDAKIREQIALTVPASNLCAYCLSAHTLMARGIGLTEQNIGDAIRATAAPPILQLRPRRR
jgi:AhpD family alkylhydroperoxidase